MLRALILVILSIVYSLPALAKPSKVCGRVYTMDEKLKLNRNEKVLICGSGEESEGWDHVPLTQAEFHLKAVLQNLGYLEPRFERNNSQLQVWLGKRNKIKVLNVSDKTGILDPSRKRKVVKEALTSAKLNEIEDWANIVTQSKGYACAESSLTAQAWDGTVYVESQLGGRKEFGPVRMTDMAGLDSDVLDRYQPFTENEWYDIRKTQIMTSRLLGDGLFQSAYFVTRCDDRTAGLTLETSVGKPKILRFGIGASTEEFPFVDLTFKNARLDDKASSYTLSLHLSPIEVSLTGSSEIYIFPGWNRSFLGPRFRLAKEIESAHETNSARAGVDIGRNWDLWEARFNGRWGPTVNYTKTVRGVGPGDVTYPSIDASLAITSHAYEYLIREQYEGWIFHLFYRGQNKGLGSQLDLNRYQADFKHLWNIGGFAPPLFVLGARLETTIVDAQNVNGIKNRDLIPAEDRIYMGGDQNLRGFPRRSVDNLDLGYLTSVYLGLELRLIEELPYRLQPFLLYDLARLGNRRYALDKPVFSSEGIGLRWASPFGTLRGSFAKGNVWNEDETTQPYEEDYVLFLSFGQEF